jgi:hypothetical protein
MSYPCGQDGRDKNTYIQLRWGMVLKPRMKEYNDGLRQTSCDRRKCLEVAQNCVHPVGGVGPRSSATSVLVTL